MVAPETAPRQRARFSSFFSGNGVDSIVLPVHLKGPIWYVQEILYVVPFLAPSHVAEHVKPQP